MAVRGSGIWRGGGEGGTSHALASISELLVGLLHETGSSASLWLWQDMVSHLTRQSRKGGTWRLLCGPCISTFGKLDEQSRQRPSRGSAAAH